jgi:hypothetical protein
MGTIRVGHPGASGTPGAIRAVGAILGARGILAAEAIARDGAIDEMGEMGGAIDTMVVNEFEARRIAQREPPAELAAQKAGGVVQRATYLIRRVLRGEWREEDAHAAHVPGSADRGDRDIADAWILHLAREQSRQHPLDLGLYAVSACLRHRRPNVNGAIGASATSA